MRESEEVRKVKEREKKTTHDSEDLGRLVSLAVRARRDSGSVRRVDRGSLRRLRVSHDCFRKSSSVSHAKTGEDIYENSP